MEKRKVISIITPCYNEELAIETCYKTIKDLFDTQLPQYQREHIFCDNASTDRTLPILKEIAERDKDVKVISNSRNFGILKNTFNGVIHSSGDATVLFFPVDMQDPPELIPDFVKLWESGYEVVYGIRAQRQESFLMRSLRKIYYRLLNRFSYIEYPVDVGDFQLVDKKIVNILKESKEVQPFLRMMTFDCGFKSVGIPYTWRYRKIGKSKNSLKNIYEQSMNGFVSYTTIPLRLSFILGAICFTLSLFYILYVLLSYVIVGAPAARGVPTMIVALFFFGGMQMLFIGLLGEYIHAIYDQVRGRPRVIEKEKINF